MSKIVEYRTKLGGKHRALMLVKEKEHEYIDKKADNPKKMYELIESTLKLSEQSEEYVYLLCFNSKIEIIGIFRISHGSIDASLVNPADVFKKAMLVNAKMVAITHNHPSGNCEPSMEDFMLTQKIKKAGEALNIKLIEHVVVGNDCYYSCAKNGKL